MKQKASDNLGIAHLVETGVMGSLGIFDASDHRTYPRGARVICRTERGLEWGTVLCPLDEMETDQNAVPRQEPPHRGDLIRMMGPEDELMLARLEKHRDAAFEACQALIAQYGLSSVLIDVEHLFDGKTVCFYFLGETDPLPDELTQSLAATYEQKVEFKKFTQALLEGCGPDCGTQASGCGTGQCATCPSARSCHGK